MCSFERIENFSKQAVWSFLLSIIYKGVWSNGMTRVSKTFSGSSILSTPVIKKKYNQLRKLG